MTPEMVYAPGTVYVERYEIEDRVGSGQSGIVYRAKDLRLKRPVALKIVRNPCIDPKLAPFATERFQAEAGILAGLHSAHVVRVFDFGEQDDELYIVMELLRGPSLRSLIQKSGTFSAFRALEIVRDIAAGLREVHAQRLIHQDLKSSNVVLQTLDGGGEEVRIIDFGIAKPVDPLDHLVEDLSPFEGRVIAGTPEYMAPEQTEGLPEQASDLYALGIIAHECLSGEVPFRGAHTFGVLLQQVKKRRPRFAPELGVPAQVEELVDALTRKDPALRPTAEQTESWAESLIGWARGNAVRSARGLDVPLMMKTDGGWRTGVWATPRTLVTSAHGMNEIVEAHWGGHTLEVLGRVFEGDLAIVEVGASVNAPPPRWAKVEQTGSGFRTMLPSIHHPRPAELSGRVLEVESEGRTLLLYSEGFRYRPTCLRDGGRGAAVIIDGFVVGQIVMGLGEGPDHDAPYGVVLASASRVADTMDRRAVREPAALALEDAEAGLREAFSMRLRDSERSTSEVVAYVVADAKRIGRDADVRLDAAEALIGSGELTEALEILKGSQSRRGRQLEALALDKLGRHAEAIEILDALARSRADVETYGIFAGVLKRQWLAERDLHGNSLRRARELYEAAWTMHRDPYVGINAATLALLSGESALAQSRADAVAGALAEDHRPPTAWRHATLGEAHLLRGDILGARAEYARAVARAPTRFQDQAVMLTQAREILSAMGADRKALDGIFSIPRVVGYLSPWVGREGRSGHRMTHSGMQVLQARIRELVRALTPAPYAVGSAARGPDLLFLEAVLELGGRAKVFLPFRIPDFRARALGGIWTDLFDKILRHPAVEVQGRSAPAPEAPEAEAACLEQTSRLIGQTAAQMAQTLAQKPLLFAIFSEGEADEGWDGTECVLRHWRSRGFDEVVVRPGD